MKTIKLPAISTDGQAFCTQTLNDKEYKFEFHWCETFCIADIYLAGEEENIYLIKGYPLVLNIDLIERVKNEDLINGKLYFRNIYDEDTAPEKDTFSTDYELVYLENDENLLGED